MINKTIQSLLEEKLKLKIRLQKLADDYQNSDNDNEDTWGGHDGPLSLQMENEKYLLDSMIVEIDKELIKLGYQEKIG